MDLDALVSSRSMPAKAAVSCDAILASDQNGRAKALVDEGHRGADDLLFLALGEDDALGIAAHALEDALQRAGDGIAPGGELRRDRPCMSTIGLRATPDIHGGLAPPRAG